MKLNYKGKPISHKDTPAYRYASGVMEGKDFITIGKVKKNIKSGRLIKLACERFFRDLEKRDFELDWDLGYKPIKFAENICHHHKGIWAGQPFELEPHQHFVFLQTYGWIKDNGLRRVRRVFKTVARKNGKTSEKAIESLFHINYDGGEGAQVWCGATKEEQARILVNDAGKIAIKSTGIRSDMSYSIMLGQIKRIYHEGSGSSVAPLGQNSDTQDGFDPSLGVIDEYHAHKTDAILNIIESGMGSRPQPLISIITTAGFNKSFPCFAVTRKAGIDLVENKIQDDAQMSFIFEMDKDDQWDDPDNYIKSNPNLGASISMDFLTDRLKKAKNEGGTTEVDFRTKNTNTWVDAPDVWISDDIWQKNRHGTNKEVLAGQKCWAGLDLAGGTDFNAFVMMFPEIFDDIIPVKPMFWLPSEKVRNRKDGQDFTNWVNAGYIKTTPGNIIDYDIMVSDMEEEMSRYGVEAVGYDRAMAHSGLVQDCLNADMNMFEVSQFMRELSTPTKEFEMLVNSYRFDHFDNPVMRWMMGNVVIQKDSNNNIKIDKKKSLNKIDGIAALINAIAKYYTPVEDEIVPQIYRI